MLLVRICALVALAVHLLQWNMAEQNLADTLVSSAQFPFAQFICLILRGCYVVTHRMFVCEALRPSGIYFDAKTTDIFSLLSAPLRLEVKTWPKKQGVNT